MIGIFLFLLLGSPCKNLKSYDTPLCHFSNGGTKNKKEKNTKNSGQPSAQRRSDQLLPLAPLKVLAPGYAQNKKKKRKIPKIVAYSCFDKTVCTAPLGPIFPHADGGPRSRVCAHETLHSAPHRHERNFSNICPKPSKGIYKVSNPKDFF